MSVRSLLALGACLGLCYVAAGLALSCGSGEVATPTSPPVESGIPVDGSTDSAGPDSGTKRPSNTSCRAPARPPIATSGGVTFVPAFPNYTVQRDGEGIAIDLARSRFGTTGPPRWFVVQRDGRVWTFVDPKASKTGLASDGVTPVEQAELFIDTHESINYSVESGLFAMALDPDFGFDNGATYAYIHFSHAKYNQVWRYHMKRNANAWTVDEMVPIMMVLGGGDVHFGGGMKFGADGYLYIALGDGGPPLDPADATRTNRLRGKILRIDPRGKATYGVPTDNPYRLAANGTPNSSCNDQDLSARVEPCPEVFAKGLRNPYRFSFDRETQKMWLGDVGSTEKEEINLIERGFDYGWRTCEGDTPVASCPPSTAGTGFVAPVAQFRDSFNQTSVIGGTVYRGLTLPKVFRGAYLFAEIYSGELYAIDEPYKNVVASPFNVNATLEHPNATTPHPRFRKLGIQLPGLSGFNEDELGEIYVTRFDATEGGGVLKMVPAMAAPVDTIPAKLSLTGCVDPSAPEKPAQGVVPYDINAPFWSDGADKERFVAIPDDAKLAVGPDGRLQLPKNGVAVKHFRLNGKLVETRLFVRHDDGGYAGYTYAWQDDQKDALLANPLGESRLFGTQVWSYPSRAQCLTCHNDGAGGTLGLDTRQLHRNTQLDSLGGLDLFDPSVDATKVVAFDDPFGAADLDKRARAYLHVNCAMCHRAGARPDLVLGAPTTHLCDAPALVVAGQPGASPLLGRLTDANRQLRMPKGGGNVIDTKGAGVLRDWITSRTTCP